MSIITVGGDIIPEYGFGAVSGKAFAGMDSALCTSKRLTVYIVCKIDGF